MLTIRRAEPRDVPDLLALIRELAAYERLEHEVVATEADLLRDGFSASPRFQVELATWDGAVAGYALWFHTWSTFAGRPGVHLEDLFVRPALRGRGIGTALLRHLARVALDAGCARLEWQVLDWNARARALYERLGARALDAWVTMRVSDAALAALAAPGGEGGG